MHNIPLGLTNKSVRRVINYLLSFKMANNCLSFVRRHVTPYWKSWIVVLTPLILLPLPIFVEGKESRAGYGVLLMTILWLTAALPLAVTSLLPLVVFPVMDIMSTSDVCSLYFKESNVVFFGGVVLALGVEKSNLHRRIALRAILVVGSNPRWLMLGFMMIGMALSLWITNSGVTAMLIPIVEAVVDELFQEPKNKNEVAIEMEDISIDRTSVATLNINDEIHDNKEYENNNISEIEEYKRKIRTPMILSLSYAASIGGAGTLIGSGAPLAFNGILEDIYGTETGMNFTSWMAIGVPTAIINTLLTWAWLQIYFGGCKRSSAKENQFKKSSQEIHTSIRNQYKQLGPITFYEKSIMALFSLLILLWIFKDPQFMPGWEEAVQTENKIGDATVAVAIVVLAFILPAKPNFWCFRKSNKNTDDDVVSSPSLLDWRYVQQKFPWDVLLLLGGGYAISDASKVSGLSHWIGHQLAVLQVLPPMAIMILMCILASLLTEVAANTATASILLPIVAQMGEATKMNPLYLMIPVAITCCYAFMLPVGTPSNAMVFSSGKMKSGDMIKPGIVMNIFTILVICAVMETIGTAVFDLHTFPDWAIDKYNRPKGLLNSS